jgi:hypothetical protein
LYREATAVIRAAPANPTKTAAAALLVIVGIACSSQKTSIGGDFPESTAIRVEIDDDVVQVDGAPATRETLGDAVQAAHKAKGGSGPIAVLLTARFKAKTNETILAFEQRKTETMEDVQNILTAAGVRRLHVGPVAKDGNRAKEPAKENNAKENSAVKKDQP